MKRILTVSVLCLMTSFAYAEVPNEIIDECYDLNSKSYTKMPECLKKGTVAFELLATSLQRDFYGPSAQRVIDDCKGRNETYPTIWSCFINAAESAVETRELIGVKKMKDVCFASISDPDVYNRIKDEHMKVIDKYIGRDYGFDWTSYYPFKGCPKENEETTKPVSAPSDRQGEGLSAQACSAYRDFEQVLSSNITTDLEEFFSTTETLSKDDRLTSILALGVSQSSIDFLQTSDENQSIGVGLILAALINNHHPDLLKKFLESDKINSNPNFEALGDQMIKGVLNMAIEGYRKHCH